MSTTIGFIGAGNMAGAIINGILAHMTNEHIIAHDIDRAKCDRFGDRVTYCGSLEELVRKSQYLFFAIKPQVIDSVLNELSKLSINWTEKVLISMVAGISTEYIAKALPGNDPAVIRIMPNTPIMLGCGTTGICANGCTAPAQIQFVKSLLEGASCVYDVPEEQMNPSINMNGSSPAYLFLFAKAAVDYAKTEGMDEKLALHMFANTMIGSAKMLTESNMDPHALINMVTSPGGTTLAALSEFESCGFENMVHQAMKACTKRAYELGK
jgi:pyrroline-5-carboxylate reductase